MHNLAGVGQLVADEGRTRSRDSKSYLNTNGLMRQHEKANYV